MGEKLCISPTILALYNPNGYNPNDLGMSWQGMWGWATFRHLIFNLFIFMCASGKMHVLNLTFSLPTQ